MKLRVSAPLVCVLAWMSYCAVAVAQGVSAASSEFSVMETTIAETQAAVRAGKVTCRQLTEVYLNRLRVYDQSTRLNTVVTLNPAALTDADKLDREFARTHTLRPLQCVVMVVKDNYDTKGLQTTAGSLAMKGFVPTDDAFMVKKIREAGAIILFKSNMAEWAFSPVVTESSIGGITRNPYDLERVPAGSSGGTAASVAANLVEVGLGSDTGDSIRGPASHTDLVGIRPTMGLTSRDGIVPLNSLADVGGPLARSVADAATVLSVVAGFDPADPVTAEAKGHVENDYTRFLDAAGLKGARLGVFRRYIDTETTDPEIKALMEKAMGEMKAGAEVVEFDIPDFDNVSKRVGCGDFQADLNRYFAAHGANAPYKSLQEVYDSGLYLPNVQERIKRALDPASSPNARPGPCLDTYHDERKIAFRKAIVAAMDAAKIDAVIYPTWSNAPRKVGDVKSPGGITASNLRRRPGCPPLRFRWGLPMGCCRRELAFWGGRLAKGLCSSWLTLTSKLRSIGSLHRDSGPPRRTRKFQRVANPGNFLHSYSLGTGPSSCGTSRPSPGNGHLRSSVSSSHAPPLTGGGYQDLDFGVYRNIPIHERIHVELRAEVFNSVNHPSFGIPTSSIDSSSAGVFSTTSSTARQTQFAAKVLF